MIAHHVKIVGFDRLDLRDLILRHNRLPRFVAEDEDTIPNREILKISEGPRAAIAHLDVTSQHEVSPITECRSTLEMPCKN